MRKKLNLIFSALMVATVSVPAIADQYIDTARVLSATPQTERVNMPRQECRTEYQQQSYSNGNRSIAGAVIGGIAGGLLGGTIGRGNGRVAAAAVGAGVGALAGDRIGNNRYDGYGSRSIPVENCYQVDNWQSVNSGYLVTYEYNGRVYSTVTNDPPGKFIDVNVAVNSNNRRPAQISYAEQGRYYDSGFNNWQYRHDEGRHRGWNRHDRDDD